MAAHLARYLLITILFGTIASAKADVPPKATTEESMKPEQIPSPKPIDHENHFRLFYGSFDQSGLLGTITAGSVSIKKSGSRALGGEYGRTFARRVFNWPLELSIDFALMDNDERTDASNYLSFRVMPKLYFTFPLSWAPRMIFGTGPSYATRVSEDEKWAIMDRDGQRTTARWLNAVYFGFDVNVGKIIGNPKMNAWHVGIGDEHRSGAFGLYSGIVGGADYKSISTEYEF